MSINAGSGDNVINVATYSYNRYDDFIEAGDGNNYVNNDTVMRSTIKTGSGDDTIITGGNGSSIEAGGGDNNITVKNSDNSTINAGSGNDFVTIAGNSSGNVIDVGAGANTVYGGLSTNTVKASGTDSSKVTIGGGYVSLGNGDNDVYMKYGENSTLISGDGDDTLTVDDYAYNRYGNVISVSGGNNLINNDDVMRSAISTGDGNDTIITGGYYSTIDAGNGDNNISVVNSTNSTVNAGTGNDLVEMASGSGENVISVGGGNNTVYAGNGTNSVTAGAGNDIVTSGAGYISVGNGNNSVSLKYGASTVIGGAGNDFVDVATYSYSRYDNIFILGDGDNYVNNDDVQRSSIITGNGNDTIITGGNSALIEAGDGDNNISVKTSGGSNTIDAGYVNVGNGDNSVSLKYGASTVIGGSGNDSLTVDTYSYNRYDNFINFGEGDNYVNNDSVQRSTILTGAGDDTIIVGGNTNSIQAGAGDNKINLNSGYNTLITGAGNDTITFAGGVKGNIIVWGGGNDVLYNYTTGNVIMTAAALTSTIEGEDIILSDGVNTMRLVTAALVGYSINTISPADTVMGELDESLRVDDTPDVTFDLTYNKTNTAVTLAADSTGILKATDYESSVATINASKVTEGIAIVGNAKNNSIKGGKGADTIYGGAGNDTVSLGAGADVYVYEGGNDVIADYKTGEDKIKLASGSITGASLSSSNVVLTTTNGNLTVKSGKGKNITIIDADGNETTNTYPIDYGVTVKSSAMTLGTKFTDTTMDLSEYPNVKTVNAASLKSGVEIIGNARNNSIKAGKGADTLYGGAGTNTLTGGKGNDIFVYEGGNDVITDYKAGEDKILLSSGSITGASLSSSNVVFTTTNGKLTVKSGKGKNITIIDAEGNETTNTYPIDYGVTVKSSAMTLGTKFTDTSISLTDYPKVKTVNAASLTAGVEIIGNSLNNSIKAGKGADTIYGGTGNDTVSLGAGADVYVYSSGNDVIADYKTGEDKIKLSGASITGASLSSSNVVFTTTNGKLTVKSGKGKNITIIDAEGNETTNTYPIDYGVTVKSSAMTLGTKFTDTTIDLSEYPSVKTVNAASLKSGVEIIGNDLNNSIKGGKGADTLIGGTGNDTLTGGNGTDIFVYESGADVITDYKAGEDKIKIESGAITASSISSSNVILYTDSGSINVKSGKGKDITVIDSDGNETTQKYITETFTSSADLFEDDNFMTNNAQIADITEITADNYSAGKFEFTNYESLAQDEKNYISLSDDK